MWAPYLTVTRMVAVCVSEPPVAVTVTVPVPTTEVPLDDELDCVLELPPPPPQPTITPTAMIATSASNASVLFLEARSRLPTTINPIAIANVPSAQGMKCGNSLGGRKPTVRVVGAVTVSVAAPELLSEGGDMVHWVPGSDAGTLHVSATAPVNPF